MTDKSFRRSRELFAQAQQLMPGGVSSPVRAFRAVGGQPIFMAAGRGSQLVDLDGNTYIDYVMSWGPLIAGHAPPRVVSDWIASLIESGPVGWSILSSTFCAAMSPTSATKACTTICQESLPRPKVMS